MAMNARGGCLCGDIRYRITGDPRVATLCHCRSCRLASGAPSVAWVVVRRGDFSIEQGAPISYRSSPPVERTFCGRCGTSLSYQVDDSPDTIDIHAATLDAPDEVAPTCEIWLEHKIAWMATNDRLQPYPRDIPNDGPA
jgi:hypothetical protein